MRRQRLDVFGALAQGGQVYLEAVDAVEEVCAEATVGGDFRDVAVRRGDDAHVNLNLAHRADAVERVGLNRAQELRLELRRELRYLVQKDRAVVGQLPQAQLAPLRAGERARLVAEELRLQERLLEGRAVQVNERAFGAQAEAVDRVRHQLAAHEAEHHAVARVAAGDPEAVRAGDASDHRHEVRDEPEDTCPPVRDRDRPAR